MKRTRVSPGLLRSAGLPSPTVAKTAKRSAAAFQATTDPPSGAKATDVDHVGSFGSSSGPGRAAALGIGFRSARASRSRRRSSDFAPPDLGSVHR